MNPAAMRFILSHTFTDAIRSRWLLVFAAVFFALASSVTLLNFFADGFDLALVLQLCDSYCPPDFVAQYLASFIAVVYPYIPLLTLPMGAALIVEEREMGTLQYVMSNPISKVDFLLGRMLGMLLATTIVVLVGFGIATVLVYGSNFAKYPPFAIAAAGAAVLNGTMLFLSMIVSSLTKRKSTAIGISVILWLLFAVVSNTATLSAYVTLKAGAWATLPAMALNPIDVSQNLATLLLGKEITGSTTGLIITALFKENTGVALGGILCTWLAGCFLAAFLLFRHQDVA